MNRRQKCATSEAKVNNFILLEPSFRLLGIQFDAQVAYDIMQAKPGVATRLLYRVRPHRDYLSIELFTCSCSVFSCNAWINGGITHYRIMRNVDLDEG